MTLKVGIIGCGGIARGKHLPALAKIEAVELVAFCDIEKIKAEEVAEVYNPKAAIFTDFREMLAHTELDVVHVCTPNQ